jgi:hypothetical protein
VTRISIGAELFAVELGEMVPVQAGLSAEMETSVRVVVGADKGVCT